MEERNNRSVRQRANGSGPVRQVAVAMLVTLLAGLVLIFAGAPSAEAEGNAGAVDVTGELAKDGTLKVEEKITFSGSAPATVQQVFSTNQTLVGNRSREQQLTDISVTADGKKLQPKIDNGSDETTVSFDPSGAKTATVSYTVTGAVINNGGSPALQWPVLQGLSLSVDKFTATINPPGSFSYVRCTAGPPNSTAACESAAGGVHGDPPTFTDGPRGEGEFVTVDIGFPAGVVEVNEKLVEHWTVARAFSAKPLPLGIALGLLVLGGIGLFAAHRRIGRDSGPASEEIHKPAEFVPVGEGQTEFRVVGDIRPGHVGTVVDERVDPIDITASLLDLSVRGHVLITELPRQTTYARPDWRLTRVTPDRAPDDLRPFEKELLDAVAPAGESALVSDLGPRVSESVDGVQSALYDEMVDNGWFQRRPDATRNTWTRAALGGLIAAVVITVLLAVFSEFGLIGITLIILALGLMFVGQEMPARTTQGSALLAGLGALRSDLLSNPTDQMPPGKELTELSEVLPYAVVLGGTHRWLDAIVAADKDDDPDSEDLTWYHGPPDWQLADLPDSLRNFITTVSGTLFSR
ncbi:DUF2207 domain-containing protein [Microlunatus soli]|uniref:Predicted membrane protein n=1 Tax=Microlunatus soli TaxID=630515 RepID=A0A1H1S0I9_9ACTN|nr:DUF2207 domain-containing protein [Microlunatus soli]SDS41491.1 Predicted membrane protein [Microlunatus soli]